MSDIQLLQNAVSKPDRKEGRFFYKCVRATAPGFGGFWQVSEDEVSTGSGSDRVKPRAMIESAGVATRSLPLPVLTP